jgi:hypothetical protein
MRLLVEVDFDFVAVCGLLSGVLGCLLLKLELLPDRRVLRFELGLTRGVSAGACCCGSLAPLLL